MGSQFSEIDPQRCVHYAQFVSHLDRVHFNALYWSFFFLVIGSLFVASWVFQWTMKYRDSPTFTTEKFRKRLAFSLAVSFAIFLFTAVLLVIEVYALLALQFCDGEDLMSLYWATWTMLQLGSEIAILGVSLALWHHLCDMEHPLWALALGTPVLVVAGFGHVLSLLVRQFYQKAKDRVSTRDATTSVRKGGSISSDTSAEQLEGEDEKKMKTDDLETGLSGNNSNANLNNSVYFTLDTGDDESVRQWPCFINMVDGKAVIRLTPISESMAMQQSGALRS